MRLSMVRIQTCRHPNSVRQLARIVQKPTTLTGSHPSGTGQLARITVMQWHPWSLDSPSLGPCVDEDLRDHAEIPGWYSHALERRAAGSCSCT